MTEDRDDILLKAFFQQAAQQQIADEGFTERVMQRLPRSEYNLRRFNRLWTAFCVAVFAVLFVAFRGWELLAVQLEVLLRTLPTYMFSINPLLLAATLFGLLFVGVGEVYLREK